MINKSKFTEMAKRVLRKPNQLQSPQIMHPAREWVIGLFIGGIIFAVSAIWSAQMYLKYRDASVGEANVTVKEVVIYRESLVDLALEKIEVKRSKHSSLLSKEPVDAESEEIVTTPSEEVSTTTEDVTENTEDASGFQDGSGVESDTDTDTDTDEVISETISEAVPELEY